MVDRIKPQAKARPLALSDYGPSIERKLFGGCQLSYRAKPTDYGEIRRYYIGLVQFGCIRVQRVDFAPYIVHLTGQDDAPAGHKFETEEGAEGFLFQQLVAK